MLKKFHPQKNLQNWTLFLIFIKNNYGRDKDDRVLFLKNI